MKTCCPIERSSARGLLAVLLCALAFAPAASSAIAQEKKPAPMPQHATGTFDVKNSPLPSDDATGGAAIGRFALDKQFHGDLEAASKGQMLGAGDPSTGTAGYVAMEYVTGTLHGRSGSFALQHFGTMEGGKFDLNVAVVPGSGKGELAGIAGTMKILIANGKHSYEFDYTLPSKE
jgi:hypothetical protein